MSIAEIRQRALEILDKYNPDGLVPFPYEKVSDPQSDIKLLFLSLKGEVSGAIYFQNDKYTILINNKKSPVRQYFTIGHELGHYYLHGDWLKENASNFFIDVGDTLDGQNMLLRPDNPIAEHIDLQKEREANTFAAELLMPIDKVKEFWSLTHDIAECAKAFQVSTSAMAIRLERLGLTL